MAGKSDTLEAAVLNHVLRGGVAGTALAQPAAVYLALYTADPTDAGTGAEVTTTAFPGYVRKVITFNAPTQTPNGAEVTNATAVSWTYDGPAELIITHSAVMNAATGAGTLLYAGELKDSAGAITTKKLTKDDLFEYPAGTYKVRED